MTTSENSRPAIRNSAPSVRTPVGSQQPQSSTPDSAPIAPAATGVTSSRPAMVHTSPNGQPLDGIQLPHPTTPATTPISGSSDGVQASRPTRYNPTPTVSALGANQTSGDQMRIDANCFYVAGDQIPHPTMAASSPLGIASGGDSTASSQFVYDSQQDVAAGVGPDQLANLVSASMVPALVDPVSPIAGGVR